MKVANAKFLIEMEKRNNTTENFRFGFGRLLDMLEYSYVFKYIAEITEEDLNWCDIYIAVRPNTPMSCLLGKAIKRSGRSYIVYFDDDLVNREGTIAKRNESSKKCLRMSDAVFGANPALCSEYGRYSKNHFVVNTAVDESELFHTPHDSLPIRFVYAAGKDHASIFEAVINPVLKKLLDEYHDIIHFTFIGVEPKVKSIGYSDSFEFIPLMPLEQYNEYMRMHTFDVGLAPLNDDRFSRMKYFNKYIEYGKLAIAGVYSNMEPYTYAVRNGENGFLVNNTGQDWYRILKYCIENIEDVRRIGISAQEDLKANYAVDLIADDLRKKLDEVIRLDVQKKIYWKKNRILESAFYYEDKIGKLVRQVRTRGLIETVKFMCQKLEGV